MFFSAGAHNGTDACAVARDDTADAEGVLNYAVIYYCNVAGSTVPAALFILAVGLLLLFLFRVLRTTAEDYLAKILGFLSRGLGLPPRLAGATVVAAANGTPDVSAVAVAIRGGAADLALSSLAGGGVFVACVVVGALLLAGPPTGLPAKGALARDACFYALALIAVALALRSGDASLGTAAFFFSLYGAYVVVVVAADAWARREALGLSWVWPALAARLPWLIPPEQLASDGGLGAPLLPGGQGLESGDQGLESLDGADAAAATVFIPAAPLRPAHFAPLDSSHGPRDSSPGISDSSPRITDSSPGPAPPRVGFTPSVLPPIPAPGGAAAAMSWSPLLTRGESARPGPSTEIPLRPLPPPLLGERGTWPMRFTPPQRGRHEPLPAGQSHPPWQWAAAAGAAINGLESAARGFAMGCECQGRVARFCLESPVDLLRRLTIPVASPPPADDRPTDASPPPAWVLPAASAGAPLWLLLYAHASHPGTITLPQAAAAAAGGVCAAVVAAWDAKTGAAAGGDGTLGRWVRVIARAGLLLLGLASAAAWIDRVATELVAALTFLGGALHVPQGLLGLTVLAWGNSVGDLVTALGLASQGLESMAMTAAFAGPAFNLLVGIGAGLVLLSRRRRGGAAPLPPPPAFLLGVAFVIAACVGLLAVGLACGRRVPRWWGYVSIGVYGAYVVASSALLLAKAGASGDGDEAVQGA